METPIDTRPNRVAAESFALLITKRIGSLPSLFLHTLFFIGMFCLPWLGIGFDKMLLVLTTVVSLDAIYLSIFIQMTVNHQARQIEEVSEDIDDIQEDVEEIQEGVEEISKDIDDIQEDVEEIQEEHEEDTSDTKILAIEQMLEALLEEVRTLKK